MCIEFEQVQCFASGVGTLGFSKVKYRVLGTTIYRIKLEGRRVLAATDDALMFRLWTLLNLDGLALKMRA